MSSYFRILNRLGQKRTAATTGESQIVVEEPFRRETDSSPSPDPPRKVVDLPGPVGEHDAALADLLDNLRAQLTTAELPCVVVAGITDQESVNPIVSGLAAQAGKQGLNLLLGELSVSAHGRTLRSRSGDDILAGDETITSAIQPSLDCGGKTFPEILRRWSEQTGATYDLLLIAAPPLLTSVETALLAKAGDGLLLIVHPFVTPRSDLLRAVEKAKTAGCPILGQVMNGTKKQVPRWLRQIIGTWG